METIDIIIACIAALGLVMTLFAYGIRSHWVNEPVLAMILGVVIGPEVLGWFRLADFGDEKAILEVVARFTLVLALVSVGVELRGFLGREARAVTVLVVAGAIFMWATTTVLVWFILGIELLPALMIGAVLAPIDPILTASVTTGRIAKDSLPERLRHLLSGESAVRHGIGLVLVLLPVLLIRLPDSDAWRDWLMKDVLWKGAGAALIGGMTGYAVGRLQKWSTRRDVSDDPLGPLMALFVALALGLGSLVEVLEGDGALAVLFAGLVYARTRRDEAGADTMRSQFEQYQQVIKQVVQVPIFVLLGAALPWAQWEALGWKAPALIISILLLRRIPALLLLKPFVSPLRRWDEALFTGWFGPIGIGALYFAAVAHKETHNEHVWVVTTLLVASTVVFHDLTATPFSR